MKIEWRKTAINMEIDGKNAVPPGEIADKSGIGNECRCVTNTNYCHWREFK